MLQVGLAEGSLEAIGSWIVSQRWFGDKGRTPTGLSVVASPRLGDLELAVVAMEFSDGTQARYFVPLILDSSTAEVAIIARRSDGILVDAAQVPAALERLAQAVWTCESGSGLTGIRTDVLPKGEWLPATPSHLEQSNSSCTLGETGFAKLFRKLPEGTSPDWEIGRFLAGRTARVPATLGALLLDGAGPEPLVLLQVWEKVTGACDAWDHAQSLLSELLNSGVPAELACEEPAIGWCRTLGLRTGELHRALVGTTDQPDFAPRPLTDSDLEATALRAHALGEEALALLEQTLSALNPEDLTLARAILARREEILAKLAEAPSVDPHTVRIRCHGDYHLGQVLWREGDALVLDFEGEPARSLAERRKLQSPLKDVAGMLRSMDYAAQVALRNAPGHEETALAWRDAASQAFLSGYLAAVTGTPLVPCDPKEFQDLLDFHLAEKLLYELLYELRNRPTWVGIPLSSLARVCS
ncbi:MAG: maltose alpha-D-glucosyltransferase [Fibrobacterota bacterium]